MSLFVAEPLSETGDIRTPWYVREYGLPFEVVETGDYMDTSYDSEEYKYVECTHEYALLEIGKGRIVTKWTDPDVRVMSDVYANVFYCVIAMDDGTFVEVMYHSNHGSHPLDRHLKCEVDAPHLADQYVAWKRAREEKKKAEEEARMAPIRAARAEKERRDAERKAKRQAKLDAARAAAQKDLEAAPPKGTRVRVADKVGEVFWSGVTSYRGKVSARLGVRIGKGREDVIWCEAGEATRV